MPGDSGKQATRVFLHMNSKYNSIIRPCIQIASGYKPIGNLFTIERNKKSITKSDLRIFGPEWLRNEAALAKNKEFRPLLYASHKEHLLQRLRLLKSLQINVFPNTEDEDRRMVKNTSNTVDIAPQIIAEKKQVKPLNKFSTNCQENTINDVDEKIQKKGVNKKPTKKIVNPKTNQNKPNNFVSFLRILRKKLKFLLGFMIFPNMLMLIGQTNGLEFHNEYFPILKWNSFENVAKNTTSIFFSNCSIFYVEYTAFNKFENMTYLSITGNKLKTFNIARNQLRVLDLADNQISFIEQELLLNSPYLEELYLEHNNLNSIDWNLNAHLNLQKIMLNENQLTTITLISPTLQELWIKFENGRVVFSTTSKMAQLTFLETSGTETDADLCWLSNSTLMIRSTQEDKICNNSTTESKAPVISFVKQESVNCGLSTLRANYDDIIISKEDFQLTIMYFHALVATAILLFCANCIIALLYCRSLNPKQKELRIQAEIC
ncbi:uncharacterized protein [Atheta coriaria]|uniref:uncharacterized protein n=1 Tax=Dalotia coriaria TaxID=877792 RepID=UPI0031F3E8A3